MTEHQNATTPMSAVSTDPAHPDGGLAGQSSMTDRASETVDQGKQAVGEVAASAADRARDVTDETARQARDLLGEARTHLDQQVSEQHRNLVNGLRSLGDELGRMHADEPGLASDLVDQARERVNGAADWFEQRQPGDLVGEVRGFARRRPGAFLIGAAIAGVAVGRLTRGAVAAHTDDTGSGAPDLPVPVAQAGVPQAGYAASPERPADDLYGVGATPTTPYNASTEPAPQGFPAAQQTPGYSAPTYPPAGGGYGGPQ